LLTEALRLGVPRPAGVPDKVWKAFEHAGKAVRTAQSGGITASVEERDPVQAYKTHVQAMQEVNVTLDAAIERIRTYSPHFLEEIDFPAIQAQILDEHTALIAFCITEQGSMGFVVSQQDQEVQVIEVIEVPAFTQTDLRRLFAELDADRRVTGGWLGAYARYLNEHTTFAFDAWRVTITKVLAELGECLLTPILSTLSADIERLILLPSAELFLCPLQAVPLSGNTSELVCDHYQVSYTPSTKVLAQVPAKAMQGVIPELYAVINPEADPNLVFTPIEGAAIVRLFARYKADEGHVGTKQQVIAGVQGRTYVHFSCHGVYEMNDPAQSGLILTDGRLTLGELQRGEIDLSNIRLVTLSACETGIIHVFQHGAEEYVGLPAGFMMAGVPCVVSSLWAVPDLSTALLMERFYVNHLRNGMDYTAALCEAQKWVRELKIGEVAEYAARCYRQSKQREKEKKELLKFVLHYHYLTEQNPSLHPFAHPYYWAAFTVNGW
jgi:CHAT domain-containing protein